MNLSRWLISVLAAAALAGCDSGGGDDADVQPAPSVGAERTFGTINRLPNGVATITSEYVVRSITCDAGKFTMVTSAGSFVGTMDCTAQVTPETIEAFIGKPVLITITDTRLKIEHPEAGSLDYPAAGVTFQS